MRLCGWNTGLRSRYKRLITLLIHRNARAAMNQTPLETKMDSVSRVYTHTVIPTQIQNSGSKRLGDHALAQSRKPVRPQQKQRPPNMPPAGSRTNIRKTEGALAGEDKANQNRKRQDETKCGEASEGRLDETTPTKWKPHWLKWLKKRKRDQKFSKHCT